MAPFGYINTRVRTSEGREIRTVEVDPERSDTVRWLYTAYASGDWTLVQLRDDLERRGVTALPRPNKPAKPLSRSNIDSILKNRYYVGAITFEGVEYPGKHEPLISEGLWHRAPDVRLGRFQVVRSRGSGRTTSRDRCTAVSAATSSASRSSATAKASRTRTSTA